ncbi:hypothetical protein KC19_7G074800 [Ceratodon purpureus]|uniref:Uncharacterized protein n=1 Tax=Ceratodon purpureus TaxID=3225 RepID=A0A8T0H899_CERPU|nr:hypothetical protein KC19_7G074800 [Ceratodon purpureus]
MNPPDPNPNLGAVDVETLINGVDRLELDSYAGRRHELHLKQRQAEEHAHAQKGRSLTTKEKEDIEEDIVAIEKGERVKPVTTNITLDDASGATETVTLAHSYTLIRNLVKIDQHPIYKKALAEWEREVALFESRVERKTKRSEGLKEEIYSVIGFYSVFQGVLLTATSQSNYLHCQNVGIPIALSAFASVFTLVHIRQKFQVIRGLQKNIDLEGISLKEVKARVLALKERGPEGFRFYDFLEDKEKKTSFHPTLCGLRGSSFLVPVAILLFSVVFLIAHPLILCRPGPK